MPRRGPGWIPKLTHRWREGRGRVRLPDRGDVYLGQPGCWPRGQPCPPEVRTAYEAEIAAWLARKAAGVLPTGRITVAELLDAFRPYCENYYQKNGKPTREVSTLRNIARRLRLVHGYELADEMTPAKLHKLQASWAADGLCRRTVNAYCEKARRIFRWGVDQGLVQAETWHALQAVRGLPAGRGLAFDHPPVRPVADEQYQLTLAKLNDQMQTIASVQRLAGCRPCEAVGLRLSCLDRLGPVWIYHVPPDSNKVSHKLIDRIVYLGPRAQAMLLPWIAAAEKAGRDRLFVTQKGDPVNTHLYATLLRDAAKRAGVREWGPNRLRHNAGTAIRASYGLEAAQAVLGHQELRTTQVYAERQSELAKRVAMEQG